MSAGLNSDATVPVSSDLIEWADLLVVMEQAHKSKLSKKFREHLKNKKIVVLGIPDDYEYMQPELVDLLKVVVPRYCGV